MFHYYFQSFNLRFKGRSSRKEFVTVMIIDIIILALMSLELYFLHYSSTIPYFTFSRPIFKFFYPARKAIYLIVLTWLLARYVAWQALSVRRAHDLGKEDKSILIPFFKFKLFFQKGQKEKNKYGTPPHE